jgi:hypothetical protein
VTDTITDILSGGAFTRQQADALRLLLGTVTGDPVGTAAAAITAHEAAIDPHPGYLTETEADALYAPIGVDTDPWTHVTASVDQTVAPGTTETNITGMAFTPGANKTYQVRFVGAWEASSTSSGQSLYLGVTWPTGVDGALLGTVATGSTSMLRTATAGATFTLSGSANAAIADTPYPVMVEGMLVAGATPSGALQLRMRTNAVGAHTITIKAGSTLSYRELP